MKTRTTYEERQKALDDFWKVRNQKVFRIGETQIEWIVAESKELAVVFSENHGVSIEEALKMRVEECDVNETLLFPKGAVPQCDFHLRLLRPIEIC